MARSWAVPLALWCLPANVAGEDQYVRILQARARRLGLAETREWRVLGHYRRGAGGRFESEVDGEAFFLARHGKWDPSAELDATIAAFFEPDPSAPDVQHPQCRFRGRWHFLQDRLGIDPERLRERQCERFERWSETLAAHSVTLVFSSAYLNNPASMFGHTFLRLDRERRGRGRDLLAYAVDFAARPTTLNPVLYAVFGVAGWFPGNFSTMPYYLKVREYNDLENRDIWEYELDLTPEEVDRMVRHLWELGLNRIDYFYFYENCSYQILTLLEAARPALRLTDRFSMIVTPTDTVRAIVSEPGLVRDRVFRPSRLTTTLARRGALQGDEVALAADWAEVGAARIDHLPPERQALVLDAAYELFRYRVGEEELDEAERRHEERLLRARARVRVQSEEPRVEPGDLPEEGHGTSLVALGAGGEETGGFLQLTLRPALHDVLASQVGYAENTQIEFFRFELRQPFEGGLPSLERFDVLRIVSLAPLDPWVSKLSWRLSTGVDRVREDRCEGSRCLYYGLSGGPGIAARVGPLVAYGFLDLDLGAGPGFRDEHRVAGGASGGILAEIASFWRLQGEASYLWPLAGEGWPRSPVPGGTEGPPFRLLGALALGVARNLELRTLATLGRGYWELSGMVVGYY